MTKANRVIIYVELLEEGTPCWRPVEAEHLGSELYRIVGEKPEDEVWAFSVGDVVRCKLQAFQTDCPQLVAHEKANQ